MQGRNSSDFNKIETWVFDLDNTLYPASSGLFPLVQERMNAYICRLLGVTLDEAKVLRAQYFREHGTTMHGLMAVHRIDPHEFMAFVHDVDLSVVPANPELVAALDELSGRKLIYTNGSVPHAENLLKHLGISRYFDDIFDIAASDFTPKPAMTALRRELGTHWLIRRALHHFQQKDYSQLVDLLDASTRESLGEINRDESTRLLWNVVRRQPRLVLLGLRGLLMGRGLKS